MILWHLLAYVFFQLAEPGADSTS